MTQPTKAVPFLLLRSLIVKILTFFSFMQRCHKCLPDLHRIGSTGQGAGASWGVKADPDAGGIVSGVADEPAVDIVIGGAGLACAWHIRDAFSFGSAAGQDAF